MFVCLDLGFAMLCALHGLALVGLWGHLLACGCIRPVCGLFKCNHLREHIPVMLVCLMHSLSLLRAMLCFPYLLCAPVWLSLFLCIFARLSIYSCMSPCLLVPLSLIPAISCWFTPVFDTQDLKSLLGILLDGTCDVHTPISWNYEQPIQTNICPPRTTSFV